MCISNKNNLQRIIAPIPSLPPLISVTKKVHTCKCCKILDQQ